MARLIRLLRRILGGVGFLLLFFITAVGSLLWLTLPESHETRSIPGLSAPVDITFDRDGIPRIRAANRLDAAIALGYVHARDRMFQMEMMRRAASGRLSEIVGPATLDYDRTMRVLGLRYRATADFAALPEPTRVVLQAYARGVNAWIDDRGRFSAPECLLLGRPEPWTPVDSLLWGKTMGLYLSENWRVELSRLSLAGHLSPPMIDELWPPVRDSGHPEAAIDRRFASAAAALLSVLPRFPAPYTVPQTSSNEWAVDGSHSASGAPLLAGDPHLAFSFPGIWYLARIDTPEGALAGATAPGVPFLVLGHNGHIAWTFTTTGPDTQDVFIETPAPDGGYETPEGPRPFTVREERIHIRGQADQLLNVRETRHGPVISDLGKEGPLLAVEMANLTPGDTAAAGLLALNEAGDVEAASRAAAMISSPVQNLLVADRERIALYVTGRVPIRRSGDGSVPAPGIDGSHDWIGWALGEQLPQYIAPASGHLVNANERIAPPDFPVFLGHDWFGDWRARRIRALLKGNEQHTQADFATMQTDVISTFATQLLPVLRAVRVSGQAAAPLALLDHWDGSMSMDLPQPLIFNAWLQEFRAVVFKRWDVPAGAVSPFSEFVAFLLSPPGKHWCGGDCEPILASTLTTTVAALSKEFGPDPSAWRWGNAHQAEFAHPLLRGIPLLAQMEPRIAAPGDATTIDRGGIGPHGFTAVHGASFRGVYNLANLEQSRFIIAPGQSGILFSRHARDFLTRWRNGDTISLGPVVAEAAVQIRLNPGAGRK
jgi:penicillin amidase